MGSPFWKRLDMTIPGSVEARLGPKNLEAKYQKTAIRTMPARLCPMPPPCRPAGACPCGCAATAAAAGCDMAAGELDRGEGSRRRDAKGRKFSGEEFCVIDALGWFYEGFYRFLLPIGTWVVEKLRFESRIDRSCRRRTVLAS
jgi:hypothetical protein